MISLALLGVSAIGNAGARRQDERRQDEQRQGAQRQGAQRQGAQTTWLAGESLAGVLSGSEIEAGLSVEIFGFRGDVVDGLVQNPTTGAWEPTELHPQDLIGLHWSEQICFEPGSCVSVTYRIASAEIDSSQNTMVHYPDNSDVWLHHVQFTAAKNPGEDDWHNACDPDSDHIAKGMFVNGQWNAGGSVSETGYTFSCTRGVIAKCVRGWGYKPWKSLISDGGEDISLQPLHQACVRAARADYCGDGVSHTEDGTLIDMFDAYGFNVNENLDGFSDESGFDTSGARWVNHKRWSDGEPEDGPWNTFESCQLPHFDPDAHNQEFTLIYVWSAQNIYAN